MRNQIAPLWLRKTAAQLVAQWGSRRAPSRWAEDRAQRDRLVTNLYLELILAIAERIPDRATAEELHHIHDRARRRRTENVDAR